MAGKHAAARVLVADDDPVILRLLQVNLELEGFEVETATRGDRALARAREAPPSLLLLDVMMPGMTGWDVARELKREEDTADIPVVLLSARTYKVDRRLGEELGVRAYITKPFDPTELATEIRRLAGDPGPR